MLLLGLSIRKGERGGESREESQRNQVCVTKKKRKRRGKTRLTFRAEKRKKIHEAQRTTTPSAKKEEKDKAGQRISLAQPDAYLKGLKKDRLKTRKICFPLRREKKCEASLRGG